MSGINDVLKGDGCVLKKWVCRSQLCFVLCVCVCVCVSLYFLIVFYLRCRTTWDAALPFCPVIWKRMKGWFKQQCEIIFHEIATDALWPDHMNSTESCSALPPQSVYQLNTETVFAQWGDSQALKTSATAERSPNMTCFLPSSPTFFFLYFSSLSLCLFVPVSIERKKHMFPSKGSHIKHKLFLVKGWALFQGQSETLSGRQRAIRALAPAQVYTEYIWSVNICIQRINGLDRPLITD